MPKTILADLQFKVDNACLHESKNMYNGDFLLIGRSAFAIWRSFYFSKLMSLRNVCQVCFDWGKAVVFGREIATVYRANGKYGAEINTTASSATNNKK